MPEPRPIPRKVVAGGVLLAGAAIALVVLRAKNEPLVVANDAAAPAREERPPAVAPPPPTDPASAPTMSAPASSTTGVDLGPAMLEARKLDEVRSALARNDAKAALAALDSYEKIVRGPGALRHEATVLRIEALAKAGRRSDAKALAMSVRDDPSWADDRNRIANVLEDAGLD